MTVGAGTNLTYAAAADVPLTVGGSLSVTGGTGTVLGGSIGATPTSAQIAVAGAATISDAAHTVNVFGTPGTTPATGAYTLLQGGVGSSLNPATAPTLGRVLNNTNFTVDTSGTFTRTATALQVNITSAPPLTTAFWKGGLTGATNVWAASNGSTQSNWVATSGGGNQALVPGAGTDVTFSNSAVTTSPNGTTLGAPMTIRSLTQQDTVNPVALNDDGFALTITPTNPATGITMASGAQFMNIFTNLVLGAPQTWTNSTVGAPLFVGGAVSCGANLLTLNSPSVESQITGPISGSGGLTMTGTWDLYAANTFSGPLSVQAGLLQIQTINNAGSPGPLGTGVTPVIFGNSSLNYLGPTASSDRAFTTNTSGDIRVSLATTTLTLSGVIGGAGALGVSSGGGSGTLALAGAASNTYGGLTTVGSVSTLLLNKSGSANAIGNVGLTINSGGRVQYTGSSTDMMGTGTVTITGLGQFDFNGKTDTIGFVTINAAGATAGTTPIRNTAGGGNLTIGALGITPVAGFTSVVDAGSGGTLTLGGTVTFTAATTGQARIAGTTLALGGNRTFSVGLGTGGTFDLEISSAITGSSNTLTKLGTGRLLLSGANAYTGATTISAGAVIARNASAFNPTTGGAVSVATGAALNYFATADAPLGLASTLGITGGAGTAIGGSLGASLTGARIAVAGAATATGAVAVNVFSLTGTQAAGTYTLLQGGGGSNVSGATYSLGTVFNNVGFTVGTPTATATDLQVAVTSATPLTAAFWKGGLSGATNVWAASNGSTASNWTSTAGGAVQGLVPGAGADVTISATAPTTAPSSTSLGASVAIQSLTVADRINGLGLNADGNTLTLGSGGLTVNARVPASTLSADVALGASQTWAQNSAALLTVNGTVSGTADLTKAGPGTLLLSGANSFTGTLAVNGGVVSIPADGALGNAANGVTLGAGGTLRLTTVTPTIPATRVLTVNGTAGSPSGLDLVANQAVVTVPGAGQITGSGVFTVSSTSVGGSVAAGIGTLSIEGANPGFTGSVNVGAPGQLIGQALARRVFIAGNGATLRLQNAGTLSGATGITVNNNAGITITQPLAAVTGRLGTTPLTFHNGHFLYDPNGSVAISETFGTVASDGMLVLTGSNVPGPAAGTVLNFGTLTRTDRATLALQTNPSGAGVIGGATGVGVNYLFSGMADSGGTAGTTSRGVVPWAAATTGNGSSTLSSLVTYDGNGFRALASTEQAAVGSQPGWDFFVTTAQAQNVLLFANVAVGAPATVNALAQSGTVALTGTNTVTNNSGALVASGVMTFNGPTLSFPNGAYFHLGQPILITGTSVITGASGVTTSSLSGSTNAQLRLTNTVANPFTGGLTINGLSQVTFTANNQLGQDGGGLDAGSITLGGGQLLFSPASATTVSLSDTGGTARPIAVNASQGTISTTVANAVLQVPGVISGTGQLQLGGGIGASTTGVVELTNPAANTFSGGSLLTSGIVRISRGDHLGTGPILLNGAQLQAGASFTLATAPTVIANTTINTQAFDLTLAAGLDGTGSTATTLTKTGTGALILGGSGSYTGPTTVTGGTLLIAGSIGGSTTVSTGAILGGTGTAAAVTVNSGGSLQGGDGSAASGALTSDRNVSLSSGSFVRLTLGAAGAHSSLARTGGTWAFASAQAFTFTLAGAEATTYDNVITGLAGTETGISTIGTWTVTNAGFLGTFSYDGAGGVDLAVTAVPEPTTTALLAGVLGLLGFVRRRHARRSSVGR